MRHSLFLTAYALFTLLICSCSSNSLTATQGESIAMRYASFLTLSQQDGFVTAEIKNPWDTTKLLHRYYLVPKDKQMPEGLTDGDIVRTPLSHAIYYSSVHISLADELGAYNSIAGVCDREYIYLDKIQSDVREGRITDCGNSMAPDMEKIIELSPDAILLSPFENSGTYGKLGKLGIPLIECADYMETSPLGRAEWMRFYGLLTGTEQVADSLFADIEKSYNSLKSKVTNSKSNPKVTDSKSNPEVTNSKSNPKVMGDLKTGNTWYVAGSNSTVGRLYNDAGADYVFKDEQSTGSVPYDPEVVFDRCQQADIWLIKYNQATDMTYSQLATQWPNYSRLAPFTNHKIYGCNLSKVPFYEETPFHPDRLLKDLIAIFHPEAVESHNPRYFTPLP